MIQGVEFPQSNDYFEDSSADGYAFLGIARKNMGLPIGDILIELKSRKWGLNREHKIRGTITPADTVFIYTMWPVFQFYLKSFLAGKLKKIIQYIDGIGIYPNDMQRYGTTEIKLAVPNVSALSAHMLCVAGRIDDARIRIEALRREQTTQGNWQYIQDGEYTNTTEDSMHIAMIIIGLRGVKKYSNIPVDDIIQKALVELIRLNTNGVMPERIGWNPAWVAVASKGLNNTLYRGAINTVLQDTIKHKNFRVRAMGAWALSEEGWL